MMTPRSAVRAHRGAMPPRVVRGHAAAASRATLNVPMRLTRITRSKSRGRSVLASTVRPAAAMPAQLTTTRSGARCRDGIDRRLNLGLDRHVGCDERARSPAPPRRPLPATMAGRRSRRWRPLRGAPSPSPSEAGRPSGHQRRLRRSASVALLLIVRWVEGRDGSLGPDGPAVPMVLLVPSAPCVSPGAR